MTDSIWFNSENVMNIDRIRLNGDLITEELFLKLSQAPIDAVLNGRYLGVVRIIRKNKVISYIVIERIGRLYKDTVSGILKTLSTDKVYKDNSEEIKFTDDETIQIEELTNQLQEIHNKIALSTLINKIKHKQTIYVANEVYDRHNEIGIEIDCRIGKASVCTRYSLADILDSQFDLSEEFRFKTNVEVLAGFISDDDFNTKIVEIVNSTINKIEEAYRFELKDWFTKEKVADKKAIEQDIRKMKKLAGKYNSYVACIEEFTEVKDYSNTDFIETKIRVILTGNSRCYTHWDIPLGDIIVKLKLYDKSIEKINSMALELNVSDDDTALEQLKQQYIDIEITRKNIKLALEARKSAERERFNQIKTEVEQSINKALDKLVIVE